jgi:hypothetical protein
MNLEIRILFFLLFCSSFLFAQDPETFLFSQHGSLFNPALAGSNGSQSISLAYRQEWLSTNDVGYHTAVLSYEESLPCSILDYGINALWDQEGDGFLTTFEISPRVSANLPLIVTRENHINLRLGAGMSFGRQQVQFDKLVFSDQLHPKYGNIFPSSFIPPDENVSGNYFQPEIGALLQMIFNKQSYNAIVINVGASFHNAYAFGNSSNAGYGKSVLGLLAPQSPKFSAHFDFELVPGSSLKKFVSIKPLFLYERQQALHYIQYGLDFGLTDAVRVGGYVHQQSITGPHVNTNWISVTTLFRPYIGNNRADFYLTYSFNVSGLRNSVSPLLELGFKKHFRNSPVCRLMDKGDDISYSGKPICRYFRFSPARKKFYENIWYRN